MDANLAVPHKRLEEHGKRARGQTKQNHSGLMVSLCHVATPDADARVSRTLDILLEAAAKKDTVECKGRPKTQQRRQSDQASSEEDVTYGKIRTIRKGKKRTDSSCQNS